MTEKETDTKIIVAAITGVSTHRPPLPLDITTTDMIPGITLAPAETPDTDPAADLDLVLRRNLDRRDPLRLLVLTRKDPNRRPPPAPTPSSDRDPRDRLPLCTKAETHPPPPPQKEPSRRRRRLWKPSAPNIGKSKSRPECLRWSK